MGSIPEKYSFLWNVILKSIDFSGIQSQKVLFFMEYNP